MPVSLMTRLHPYRTRLSAACFALLCLAATALALWADRINEIQHGETLTRSVANGVVEQIEGRLRSLEGLLAEVAEAERTARWAQPAQRTILSARISNYPELLYVGIVTAQGVLRNDTLPFLGIEPPGISVQERDYARHHLTTDSGQRILVGRPILDPITKERTLTLSKAVRDPQGRLLFIVLATLSSDYFANILDHTLLDPEGATALLSVDGDIMARAPAQTEKFGENIGTSDLFRLYLPQASQGVAQLVSKADGNRKILAYHSMERFPLVVTSGLSLPVALQSWYWRSSLAMGTAVILLLALFAAAWLADQRYGRLKRQQALLEQMVQDRTALLTDAQAKAEQRSQRLESINDKLTRLAQITAHHLQEPLRPIVSFTQLARRQLQPEQRDIDFHLDYVERGGLRLKTVLQAFQRYTETLSHQPHFRIIDLSFLVAEILERLHAEIRQHTVNVTVAPLPKVLGDRAMLECALFELIHNAISYTHPNRLPQVEISAQLDENHWSVSIKDNGPGIPASLGQHLFQPFARPHSDHPESLGLGLAMALTIAEAHNGTIQINSTPEGSTLTFWAPLCLMSDSPA